ALRARIRADSAPIRARSRLRGATLGDRLEPLAQLGLTVREIVEPRQLRQALEPEDALEQRGRPVSHRSAGLVRAARLGDQPALDETGHGRIGRDAADARDLRPRAGPEIRDDRKRL